MSLVCLLCGCAGACNERAFERHISINCRVSKRTRQPVLSDPDEEVLYTGPAAGLGPGVSTDAGHTLDGSTEGSFDAGQPALGAEQQQQRQQR